MELLNGWQYYEYNEVESTNDTIKQYCITEGQRIIVKANTQTAGRGRRGRSWLSIEGNLFFSLALESSLKNIGCLVLVSGLSLLQTIKYFSREWCITQFSVMSDSLRQYSPWNSMDNTVHGILQARILEWVTIPLL